MTHSPTPALDWSRTTIWGPAPVRPWTGGVIAHAVVLVVVASLLAGLPAFWLLARPDANPQVVLNHPAVLITGLVSLWAVFAGYPLWISATRGTRSLARDLGWTFHRGDVLLGLGFGVGLRGTDMLIGWIAGSVFNLTDGDNASWLSYPHPWALTVFFALGAGLVAPALEELFFRGLLLRTFLRVRRLPTRVAPAVGVAGSSVLFGVMHLTGLTAGGLYVVAMTGAIGAVLAVMALKWGRLGPAVWTHVVFNSTGVLLTFIV